MGQFVLDTSVLSGENLNYVDSIIEERGRAIQIEWVQSGADQDIKLHGFAIRVAPAEPVSMEQS